MTQKNTPFFQPAPRPVSKTSAADALRLVEMSADLGFDRPSHGKEANSHLPESSDGRLAETSRPQALSLPADNAAEPIGHSAPAASRAGEGTKTTPASTSKVAVVHDQSLKFDVSDEVWVALKMKTIERRVSMKFLILEALQQAGYPVDLDAIPEDGRRLRKASVY